MKEILMGTMPKQYHDGVAQYITFCVTEDCNLLCKYCYMAHKNSFRKMSFSTAKKAVDYMLQYPFEADYVIWDFIGGEPTIEIDLIDQICDYIKQQMYKTNHRWFNNYIFDIGTNGVLYGSEKVQNFLKKNRTHMSISITIDGIKEKHDLNRIKKDGSGSFDDVIKNIPLWQEQFPGSATKVTFASDDLKYLKDSIIYLWNLGLTNIPANIVYEDVWKDGDVEIFESQLRELAEYILDNELYYDYSVRFFDQYLGFPLNNSDKNAGFCGSGRMVAIDCDGKLFPCIRFLDFCMSNSRESLISGDLDSGFNGNIIDNFKQLTKRAVHKGECSQCLIASNCASCAGNNYSCFGSIFKRATYHCEMQKANARVNEYFWDKVTEKINSINPHEMQRLETYDRGNWNIEGAKYLYFILNDGITPHCSYNSNENSSVEMTQDVFESGLKYAYDNNMIPVYLGNPNKYLKLPFKFKLHVRMDENLINETSIQKSVPILFNSSTNGEHLGVGVSCILLVSSDDVANLFNNIMLLSGYYRRINIVKQDLLDWNDNVVKEYSKQIELIIAKELNRFCNIFSEDSQNDFGRMRCKAGTHEFALAPNGKFYPCPGFYFGGYDSIGDIKVGINNAYNELFEIETASECMKCENLQCKRCLYMNYRIHREYPVPASVQCDVSQIEKDCMESGRL